VELKDFVSETICSIIEGVKNAQKSTETNGALVNPGGLMRSTSNVSSNALWDNSTNVYAQPISFDVAVTVEENSGGKGSIKILGGVINAEAGGNSTVTNGIVNRVQFIVPVLLPVQETQNPNARSKSSVSLSGI
jgi:hypothetical protein